MNTGDQFAWLVDVGWSGVGIDGTTTTFALWRRTVAGAKSALGTPSNAFTRILAAQACTFQGTDQFRRGKGNVLEQGRVSPDTRDMLTSHQDIHPGDNVVMADNGVVYQVLRVAAMGKLTRVWLDSSQAQYHP